MGRIGRRAAAGSGRARVRDVREWFYLGGVARGASGSWGCLLHLPGRQLILVLKGFSGLLSPGTGACKERDAISDLSVYD